MDPESGKVHPTTILERTRWFLATWIFVLLAFVVLVIVAGGIYVGWSCASGSDSCVRAKDGFRDGMSAINPVFTALLGIFGSVVGFYFGLAQGKDETKQRNSSVSDDTSPPPNDEQAALRET